MLKITSRPLYKKTKNGSICYWQFFVNGNSITIEYGQLGTSSPQTTTETILVGKNIGKVNETTPAEQAASEAESKWKQQLDKGYTPDLEKAKQGERENDFPVPMLAHSYDKHASKIIFPCYAQPKLDGIRCLARKRDGQVTLYSRKGKEFTGTPHINKALEKFDFDILDGELYNHDYHDNFEHIVHLVKQQKPCVGHEEVQFHVFDIVSTDTFHERRQKLFGFGFGFDDDPTVQLVETLTCLTKENTQKLYDKFAEEGYEGVMLRNADSKYEHTRSYGLQKFKMFVDDEFKIVDVLEGRGRYAGRGIFRCITEDHKEFGAKLEGPIDNLKEILINKDKYIGKLLSVKYQGLSQEGIPRFPVGKGVRDYE